MAGLVGLGLKRVRGWTHDALPAAVCGVFLHRPVLRGRGPGHHPLPPRHGPAHRLVYQPRPGQHDRHLGVHSGSHGGEYGHLRRIYLRRYPRQRHRHPGPDHPSIIVIIIVATVLAPGSGTANTSAQPFTASAPPPPASSPQRAGVSSPSPCWTSPAGRRTASCSPCSTGAVCWWRRQSWCSPGSSPPKNCIPSSGFSSPPGQASCSSSEHSGYKTTKRSVPL